MKNIRIFIWKLSVFGGEISIYLNRRVFIMPCENVLSGICGQRKLRSACATAQPDQGLQFPLQDSLDTIGRSNREQMPGWDCACSIWLWICAFSDALSHGSPNLIKIFQDTMINNQYKHRSNYFERSTLIRVLHCFSAHSTNNSVSIPSDKKLWFVITVFRDKKEMKCNRKHFAK